MMNQLTVPTFDARAFTVDDQSQTMFAEASSLRYTGPGRLRNDACDVGIAIRGRRTERFYLAKTHSGMDGDIEGWIFRPVSDRCPIRAVTIFND